MTFERSSRLIHRVSMQSFQCFLIRCVFSNVIFNVSFNPEDGLVGCSAEYDTHAFYFLVLELL